ncbi:hypothetical protein HUK84_01155 [Nguyenibacter vanlangensis]|uniref:Uncharacterized protein n=1 Tax=Nguyenibacter vanlangensis TaxID=1216886 RepID=A0A7Y7IT05_9PROT|nr:hypothetical protein [Nguyenibacter vanlangensis]NVN09767.1 hypothetical protein [Nguyenibacter vanlangensis]
MSGIDTPLVAPIQRRVPGDQYSVLENPDFRRMVLDLENASSGGVRHAVEIAADRDHAFMTDTAFDRQDGVIGMRWKVAQMGAFVGEMLRDYATGHGMTSGIGDALPRIKCS